MPSCHKDPKYTSCKTTLEHYHEGNVYRGVHQSWFRKKNVQIGQAKRKQKKDDFQAAKPEGYKKKKIRLK